MLDKVRDIVEERRDQSRRKLRRQPRMRRVEKSSGFRIPKLEVPRTAQKRRRRNRAALHLPTAAIKKVVLSPRWISVFVLALCIVALYTVGMQESFYLRVIPVEGVASIPPTEIVEASGLGGAHIFAADPVEAAEKIAQVPGVISATVGLEWPNSAIIRIKEDTPIAVWEQGGERYWVNAAGHLVPARVDVPGLLHIRVDDVETEASQQFLDEDIEEETSEEAIEDEAVAQESLPFVPDEVLEGALALRELRPNIDVLSYDVSGGLSYQDGRGWRVYFGTGADMAQKLAVYETLVDHLLAREQTPVYISVSNEEKPFYMARDS